MKHRTPPKRDRNLLAAVCGLGLLALTGPVVTATPYATCLTNSGGVISFRLNESADNVRIISSGGAATNDLGPLARGVTTVNLGISGNFSVQVTKDAAGYTGYLFGQTNKISDDTSRQSWFYLPTGVAVNNNPQSPYFGRVFVGNGMAGTTATARPCGDGIYVLNSDLTDAVAQGDTARTAGLVFNVAPTGTSTYNRRVPWHLEVATNDTLYIADFSTNRGGIWGADMNLESGFAVFQTLYGLTNTSVHTTCNSSVIVQGSTNSSDLQIWAIDGRWPGSGQRNRILRWDIYGGPLPWNSAPNAVGGTMYSSVDDVQSDLDRGPDGKFYGVCYRDAGTDVSSLKVFDADATTELFSSLAAWGSPDPVRQIYCCKLTPDGRRIALYNIFGRTIFLSLTNGIPDISSRVTLDTYNNGTASNGKDLSFDAAGNLYVVDNITELLRVYTPGGASIATTSSDGTFSIIRAAPEVAVAATVSSASEDGTTGQFTLSRSGGADGYGNTNAPLVVGYTLSGTASNGVDYTTLSGAATFAAGESTAIVTVAPLQDTISEPTETVTLTLTNSTSYLPTTPLATVLISDTNTPVLSITGVSASIYERLTNDYAAVVISRALGNTNMYLQLDPGNFTLGGTAVKDVDYVVNSNLFPVWFAFGDRTTTAKLVSPLNNSLLDGQRTLVIGLASGTDYTAATNKATTTIIDDENPPETVLWSDTLDTADSATNYVIRFGSQNGVDDYTYTFGYDYGLNAVLPAAPNCATNSVGLLVNVNKDGAAAAAGINFYATNRVFGTNFALRFDMYLFCGTAGTTEYAIFGVNHSGNQTNWFRSTANGYTNSAYDGLWAVVEADGSGTDDYLLFTNPKTNNTVGTASCVQPTIRARRNATSFTTVFKSPPFTAGSVTGGSPANDYGSATPSWADVELSQSVNQGAPVITLRINHTVIYQYTNTLANSVAATNGLIMLGYCDAYDSIGNSQGIIYDNIRVVAIDPPKIVSQPLGAVIPVGGSTNLTVGATGSTTGVLNYQWRLNGVAIAGATTSSLPLNSIQLTNYGTYTVVVSDGVYSLTSAGALVAPPAIAIITPPASRAAVIGSQVLFSVEAGTSTGVTNYQWRLNSTNLVNQTNTALAIASVQDNSFGPYTVRVSDGYGAVTSAIANLTIAAQPALGYGVSGSSLNISFGTEVGPNYVVEYKNELTNGLWMPLVTNIGTGNPITVPDPIGPASRFYRVRMQ